MSPVPVTVVIPAYEPAPVLVDLVRRLLEAGLTSVVVVDDGSPAEHDPTFRAVAGFRGVTLVRHQHNMGKGQALRTGLAEVLRCSPDGAGAVTADADGQHTVDDILSVAESLTEAAAGDPRVLVLGERDFDLPHIPWRSRLGNKVTTTVVRGLSGRRLPDTQTGLRGVSRALLSEMLEVPGDRFDYEMRALMHLVTSDAHLVHVPITTVYEDGENATTHFRPVRDSVIIYAAILRQLGRFLLTSGSGFLVDIAVFAAIMHLVFGGEARAGAVGVAAITARVCSALVNYGLNRTLVFADDSQVHRSLGRYATLAVGIVSASWLLTVTLTPVLGRHVVAVKIAVDLGLFVLSYLAQRRWVFAGPAQRGDGSRTPPPRPRHTAPAARRSPADRPPSSVAPRARAGAGPTG